MKYHIYTYDTNKRPGNSLQTNIIHIIISVHVGYLGFDSTPLCGRALKVHSVFLHLCRIENIEFLEGSDASAPADIHSTSSI